MRKKPIPNTEVLMDILQKTIKNAWNINDHIHLSSIVKWLDNFTGEALCNVDNKLNRDKAAKREKQLALFLLCNFVYYNENEIKYLTRVMFDKYLHNVFISENKETITDDDFDKLINITQFTFLGNISESSSYLLYHFRQENDLPKQCFIEKAETENIVFIDDFSITGSQAHSYIRDHINNKVKSANKKAFCQCLSRFIRKRKYIKTNKKIYILLMITTDKAIKKLEQINNVTVLPCIVLDDRSKAFSDSSIVFAEYGDIYKNMAKKMCKYYGTKITTETSGGAIPLGFGNDEYMFGAYYNIPDNTLPIFWSSQNDWNYFLKRYEKKYNVGNMTLGGRYV
jgi:hypothetical protein